MVDLDAPNTENANAPVRHFLGGDLTFKDDGVSLVKNTPAVTEYRPPSPPSGSKPHRSSEVVYVVLIGSDIIGSVVFLLYDQPNGFKEQKEVTPETGRDAFNVSQFSGLGEPVAGTYTLVGPQN